MRAVQILSFISCEKAKECISQNVELFFKDGLRFRTCCYSPVSSSSTHFMHKKRKRKNGAQCNLCSDTFLLCVFLFFYFPLCTYVHVLSMSAGCGFPSFISDSLSMLLLHRFRFYSLLCSFYGRWSCLKVQCNHSVDSFQRRKTADLQWYPSHYRLLWCSIIY